MTRIRVLLVKEFLDLMRNATALVPVMIVTLMSLVLPFLIVVAIPSISGQPLDRDSDLIRVSGVAGVQAALSADGRSSSFSFSSF